MSTDGWGGGTDAGWFSREFGKLAANIEQVIKGKSDVIRQALVCLVAEGHLLVEDVPGVGKTSLARALAASIDGSWHRIQFTPDLLPSDVTGVSIYNQATRDFEFKPGAVFSNIVVGDEINRASPKTQSALLEVMEERRVTVDAHAYAVPRPFMVIATQNPIDMEGTYSLPEAQLDRFLMRVTMGYPDTDAELTILSAQPAGSTVDQLRPVMQSATVASMVAAVGTVHVADSIQRYIVSIAAATRSVSDVRLGASPRATLALQRAARAAAAAAGRSYVIPEDVKALAIPVLAHRIILSPEAEMDGRTAIESIGAILQGVPTPRPTTA